MSRSPRKNAADASPPSAVDRALDLLRQAGSASRAQLHDGYIDVLGAEDPTGPHPGQRWMASRTLPLIYERVWRPLGGLLLLGPRGPQIDDERRLLQEMLHLGAGERVLDVGCGPGNFTRTAAAHARDGLVIGVDAAKTMLHRAVLETHAANVAYVRADACALPFPDASFGAICCFAALYLIAEPMRALDEMARVLAPGGHVALLTSCNRGPLPASVTSPFVKALTGVRLFGRDEITAALRERDLVVTEQRVAGLGQFLAARKPAHRDRRAGRRPTSPERRAPERPL